ncbi:HD/PDEase domain protein [Acididesulfobacillus acetoxydans]|uniref:HD-GYP domain-containing protein n=1 Tax=Acididesulfobacillus acetoxydans TaxID=1561005 RepID=A0A8S0XUL7_9FIRM|nr:HD/PDEase domain protein [Acididesulfobacillus acetoxydans]CEJ07742.1 HD-GYP domain-containing protein [Acididesulfobacillus acetoxydans]
MEERRVRGKRSGQEPVWVKSERKQPGKGLDLLDIVVAKPYTPAKDLYPEIPLFSSRKSGPKVRAVEQIVQSLRRWSWLEVELDRLCRFDRYTYVHSIHVAVLSLMMAEQLAYKRKDLRDLVLGALLHDVGKERIPLALLNRPGKLTLNEFELVKEHPSLGEEILRLKPLSLSAYLVICQHHERWNGRGYPDGLHGTQIHPFAQIAAVADVYDALTTDRPYRKGLPGRVAYEMVVAGAGTDFSEEVVEAFQEIVVLFSATGL